MASYLQSRGTGTQCAAHPAYELWFCPAVYGFGLLLAKRPLEKSLSVTIKSGHNGPLGNSSMVPTIFSNKKHMSGTYLGNLDCSSFWVTVSGGSSFSQRWPLRR